MPSRSRINVDRTRDGHRTNDTVNVTGVLPKHAVLLDHDIQRQRLRNKERRRLQKQQADSAIPRKKSMHSVSFDFVFGTGRDGNQITSDSPAKTASSTSSSVAKHESLALSYTVAFPSPEEFFLSLLTDAVRRTHSDNKRRADRMTNVDKSTALVFVSGIITESVHAWLDAADDETVRHVVAQVLDTRCYRILDLAIEDDVIGHVRIRMPQV